MPIPLAALIVSALAGGAASAAGSVANRKNAKTQADTEKKRMELDLKLAEMKDRLERDLSTQKLAAEESTLDPFRHMLSQVSAAETLDRLSTEKPLNIDFSASPYAKYMPKITGGAMGYDASPELRASAAAARTAALNGRGTAPTMTNPANAGQTGVLDLIAELGGGGKVPVSRKMPTPATSGDPTALSARYENPLVSLERGADGAVGNPNPLVSPNDFRLSVEDLIAVDPTSAAELIRPRRKLRRVSPAAA